MVVNHFDIRAFPIPPHKAYTPLIIDPNTVLTGAFALERFQPIRRGNAQIIQAVGGVEHSQLAASERLDLNRQAA